MTTRSWLFLSVLLALPMRSKGCQCAAAASSSQSGRRMVWAYNNRCNMVLSAPLFAFVVVML